MVGCSTVASAPAQPQGPASSIAAVRVSLPAGFRVKELALGDYHSCVLLESGRVACWGSNGMGELGQGSGEASTVPVLVPGVLDAVGIRASRATTCVLSRSGVVSCWGDNAHGQADPQYDAALKSAPTPWGVYDSTGEPPRFTPANVLRGARVNAAAGGARSIALGHAHGCAVLDGGRVRCWGDGSRGQLGVEGRDAFEVADVSGVPPLVELVSGIAYACGRTAEGSVWCWGDNHLAQLGSAAPGPAPRQVPGVTGATALLVGADRMCARLGSGQVMCWGDSLDCGEDHPHAPVLVPELDHALQFVRAAGECFWCVLDGAQRLACDGDPISQIHFNLDGVASVAAGISHACAVRTDDSVWCWGSNVQGELGRTTAEDKDPAPAPVLWPDQMFEQVKT